MKSTFLSLPLLAPLLALPAHAAEDPDAAVYRKIAALRAAAARLRCDGTDADWRELPQFGDPRSDSGGDSRRDLVAAAIAPTESDLWIMLRTAGSPSLDPSVFYVAVDLVGDRGPNFRLLVDWPGRQVMLRPLDEKGEPGEAIRLPNAEVAIRRIVEMRISYADLALGLPEEKRGLVGGKQARPWVRVNTAAWDGRQQKIVDYGPSAASYRLVDPPYPLDAPLPQRPAAVPVGLPVRGQWFVLQAALGSFTHRRLWAYDLARLDAQGRFSDPTPSTKNEEYFAWGQPVLSPNDGQVTRAVTDVADTPPHGPVRLGAAANELFIVGRQGYAVNLVHLQKGSSSVKPGDRVTAGRQVALVGNSGASDVPHLHLAVWGGVGYNSTAPLALRNVRVGLNPVADDPWARTLGQWEPRQGYFVEAVKE